MLQHGGEDGAAIDSADLWLTTAFRVRHHPQHVAPLIDDAGNIAQCAVRVHIGRDFSVRRGIAEQDAVLSLQVGDGVRIREIVAISVRDGHAQHIAFLCERRKPTVRRFHAEVCPLAAVLEVGVSEQGARQESGLTQHLKSIADADDGLALVRHASDAVHHRRELGYRSRPEVITMCEASREYCEVIVGEIALRMPDVVCVHFEDVREDVVAINIAPRAGEDNNGTARGR